MKRLIALLTCVFASCTVFAVANGVELSSVHKIILAELSAMKLPVDSPICLEMLPARNTSETGADPSPQLLRFLTRRGMRPRKASACDKPLPKGNEIRIEVIAESAGRLSARVSFSDITITPERDLGILYRRGVYELIKDEKGEWVIQSYVNEMKKWKAEPIPPKFTLISPASVLSFWVTWSQSDCPTWLNALTSRGEATGFPIIAHGTKPHALRESRLFAAEG